MKDLDLEVFVQGRSSLHRLDPRIKIGTAGVLVGVLATAEAALLPGLLAAFALVLWAGLDLREVRRRLVLVNALAASLWLFLPFTTPGEPLLVIGPLTISHTGVQSAWAITLRSNAMILVTLALLSTTSMFALIHALRSFCLPEKLIYLLFFCYRYFFVIQQERTRMSQALRVRCFLPRTSAHTYKTYAYLVGMLLVRSYERSQRIHRAMLCRGFTGRFPAYHPLVLRTRDWGHLGGLLALALVLALLDRSGGTP